MKNNASLIYNFFLVVGDFLALVAAFVGAYILRVTISHRALVNPVPARTYLSVFLVLLPFWILIFGLLGLYSSSIYEKRFKELGRLFIGSFVGMLFVVFWDFLATKPILPARLIPIYGFLLGFVFLVIFRNVARFIRSQLYAYGIGITKLLIVGDTKVTSELLESLRNNKSSGYKVVGVVGQASKLGQHNHVRVFDSFQEACRMLGENIHGIVQTELYSNVDKNNEILTYAQTHHIAYRFTPGNAELFVGNIAVELFRSSIPVIAVHQTALLGWGRIVKRLFDLVVGLVMLLLATPFMVLIALLIKLTSRGPVFFRQVRLTRFDQEFRVFKFRTYKAEFNGLSNEEGFKKLGKPELLEEFYKNGQQIKKDPRFTRVGRFLRHTSLDELPQLFNVIKGELSLVGPRALIPEELNKYSRRHTILSVKSGLTGLAQVSGRNNISFDERRQLDMFYVQNWSFWLDLVILVKTIRVIFKGG